MKPQLLSQQEKLALKKAGKEDTKTPESLKITEDTGKEVIEGSKRKDGLLRPSTPLGQTGAKIGDNDGASPCSQACTSGSVTPSSEGIKRSDRKPHAPPGGFNLS